MHLESAEALRRAADADHGVLATINPTGVADLVPVCFAILGERLAVPIDSIKPKASTALGRVRNLEREPRATLLVERWDPDDWSRLWWVRLSIVRVDADPGIASGLEAALRARYPQYAGTTFPSIVVFRIDRVSGWQAADG